ncbi:MAG: hypothetical protein AAB757_00930 [Patescibacteria group bacterium]
MNTKYLSAIVLSFGIIFSVILIGNALAQTDSGAGISVAANIQYPITELGNCQNEIACRAYCDKPANREKCLDFAQKNNLMSQEKINVARKFLAAGKGPGNCATKDSCEKYCDEISHIDECVTFAEKNNILPPKELDEAKKVRAAIKQGVKPPSCGNKKSCDLYCGSVDHMEECIIFAQAAGLMDENEKQESQKVLEAIKKGAKPPQCRGKKECDVYCSEESHFEECMKFAEAAGFMSAEEAEMARKTGGKGPGNCRGKEQCEAFCSSPENQESCFNFAKEYGFIKQEDIQRMEGGKQKFQEILNQAPPKVIECLNSTIGAEMMEKLKSGSIMPPRDIGDKMRACFESVMGAPGVGGGQMGPGGDGRPTGMPSFESMSQEMKECLRTTLGEDAVGRLQSGVMKDEEKGEFIQKAKSCFEQYGSKQPGNMMQAPQMPGIPQNIMMPGVEVEGQTPQMFPQGTAEAPCSSPEECKEFCSKSENPEECLKNIQQRVIQIQPQQYPGGMMLPAQPPSGETLPPPSSANESLLGKVINLFKSLLGQ